MYSSLVNGSITNVYSHQHPTGNVHNGSLKLQQNQMKTLPLPCPAIQLPWGYLYPESKHVNVGHAEALDTLVNSGIIYLQLDGRLIYGTSIK